MSNSNNTATASASVAFPVFTLITGVLLVLKLGNVGSFGALSWWWVFAPMIAGFGIFVAVLVILLLVALLLAVFGK